MFSTYVKSRKTFTLSLGILPKIRKCVPLFQKNFHSHRVYFQKKIETVLAFFKFFQKKLSIGYISRIFESVQVFQNFFQKNSLSTDDYQKKYPKRSHPFPTFCRKIFISLPAISPTWSDLCAILSLNLPPGKWWAVPPLHRTRLLHTVHMRKIWKRSPFFWNFFNFFKWYEDWSCLSPSGIFPKFWKSVPLFCVFLRKTCRRTCHITNLEQLWGHF